MTNMAITMVAREKPTCDLDRTLTHISLVVNDLKTVAFTLKKGKRDSVHVDQYLLDVALAFKITQSSHVDFDRHFVTSKAQ